MIVAACQAERGTGFVSRTLNYVDCQAQAIGAGGFQSFAAPGSVLSLIVTGLLTMFVAILGYRMLLGERPGLRDGVAWFAKIGILLALAFSWPAYRTLVYDVALKGPAELASEVGRPAGLPGSNGGLVARLDYADRAFLSLGLLGTGAGIPRPSVRASADAPQPVASTFDPIALGGARTVFLIASVGALAATRLIAGVMLALGPFFIAFLLFESTRGLFEGWLRVLAGAALGALFVSVVLGVELALIEPWLVELIAWRTAGYSVPGAPAELFVVVAVFALVAYAGLFAAWRLTVGFALPSAWRAAPAQLAAAIGRPDASPAPARYSTAIVEAGSAPDRAARIADAVALSQRRGRFRDAPVDAGLQHRAEPHRPQGEADARQRQPLGHSFRRRTRVRISASARRRDFSA